MSHGETKGGTSLRHRVGEAQEEGAEGQRPQEGLGEAGAPGVEGPPSHHVAARP